MSGNLTSVDNKKVSVSIGFIVLIGIVFGSFLFLLKAGLAQTAGHFTYGLDDPYIHLAIAKNFAFHGVWGVTEYGNTSSSSSPMWTLLLSLIIKLTGKSIYGPLLLGLIFSSWSAFYLYSQFLRRGLSEAVAVGSSLAVFFVAPLHLLPFLGMEQTLQILLVLMFAFWLLDISQRHSEKRDILPTLLLTFAMCLTRYECIFLMVVPFFATVRKRDWRIAICLAVGPILAIGGFAFFSHLAGMPMVPNSILLKGNRPSGSLAAYLANIGLRIRFALYGTWATLTDLFLFAIVSAIVIQQKRFRSGTEPYRLLLWTAIGTTVLHAGFGLIGLMFRYEAYFIVLMAVSEILVWWQILGRLSADDGTQLPKEKCLLWVLGLAASQVALSTVFSVYKVWVYLVVLTVWLLVIGLLALRSETLTTGGFAKAIVARYVPLLFLIALVDRSMLATTEMGSASRDIFTQQCQMSRFLHQYYRSGRVVANDIGAISYFNHIHVLDFAGLASNDVARLRMTNQFTTSAMAVLLNRFDPDVIVVYPEWFQSADAFPSFVVPVADWLIPPVTSAGKSWVTFATTSPDKARVLRQQLKEFQPTLPKVVKVRYYRLPK